jgi:hypothetical protein
MPTFTANQLTAPFPPSTGLSARAGITATHTTPQAAQAASLIAEPMVDLGAEQQAPAPTQRVRVRTWPIYGPAEARPPSTPATPRPGVP